MINYKYSEEKILNELRQYMYSTYSEHYSTGDIETTEFIIDAGHGPGHCIGNIIKYAARYGKKDGYNRKDLLKILYYGIMMLHVHDRDHPAGAKIELATADPAVVLTNDNDQPLVVVTHDGPSLSMGDDRLSLS